MSEAPPNKSRESRLLLALQVVGAAMGTVLVVWPPFSDLLAWTHSPEGLHQPTVMAWFTAIFLGAGPALLAIAAWRVWRRGRRARDLIAGAFLLAFFGALAQWSVGGSWAEILLRPSLLAIMLWILRPESIADQ
ncbi:hypothetical protein [Nonomuraea sp. B5E05]|uniref:hypothetical protein n=1 Tax=Nonomuraea sp. B5E05 TaxID=3153569 RepID=UPI00325FF449